LFHHTARFPGHELVVRPHALVAVSDMSPVQNVSHVPGPYRNGKSSPQMVPIRLKPLKRKRKNFAPNLQINSSILLI
ncbi:MAG: hypothetical protein ABSB50_19270, partial [Terracidiphilus sp.]